VSFVSRTGWFLPSSSGLVLVEKQKSPINGEKDRAKLFACMKSQKNGENEGYWHSTSWGNSTAKPTEDKLNSDYPEFIAVRHLSSLSSRSGRRSSVLHSEIQRTVVEPFESLKKTQ
jgi:hypothetical protein